MPNPPTLTEAAAALDAWLDPARTAWNDGHIVHLAVAPGDMTSYRMTFVPASPHSLTTSWRTDTGVTMLESPPLLPDERLLVVHGPNVASIPVGVGSTPFPYYVAEKLGTDNHYTVMAVGLTWWLMAGNNWASAAEAYAELVDGSHLGRLNPLVEWDLTRFGAAVAA